MRWHRIPYKVYALSQCPFYILKYKFISNKVFLSMHIILCTRDIAQGWVLSNIWKNHLSDNVKFLHLLYIKAYLISSTIYYTLCNRCRKQGLFLIDRFVSDDPISMRHHKHKIYILIGKNRNNFTKRLDCLYPFQGYISIGRFQLIQTQSISASSQYKIYYTQAPRQ